LLRRPVERAPRSRGGEARAASSPQGVPRTPAHAGLFARRRSGRRRRRRGSAGRRRRSRGVPETGRKLMRLLGLYREAEYSPGAHPANDSLLLRQVAAGLRASGFSVDLATIDEVSPVRHSPALIFSMCQGRRALDVLRTWQEDGFRIVNSPGASLNTYR